jgi:hypothetical protein
MYLSQQSTDLTIRIKSRRQIHKYTYVPCAVSVVSDFNQKQNA